MKRPKTNFRNKFYPKVSVIVWAWESGNVIERRIKNLLSLDYPNDYEIIIVDNASKDETGERCKRFAKKGLIKYYRTKRSWKKGVGIDKAIKEVAKYDVIAILDPDGVCEKNWLKKMVKPLERPKVGATIGLIHTGNFYENLFTKLRAIEDEWNYCISPLCRNFGKKFLLICGAGYVVKRRALKDVGYHGKKTLGEDFELTTKLYTKGWDIEIVDANLWQEEVSSLAEYERQRLRWIDNTLGVYTLYAKEFLKIVKERMVGFLLFNIFGGLPFLFLLYLVLTFIQPFSLTGVCGMILLLSSLIIGLIKMKKKFLIPYTFLFLFTEPFLVGYCTLKREIIKMRGKKVRWILLGKKYYHRGVRLIKS